MKGPVYLDFPTEPLLDYGMYSGEMDGKPAWSNGHVMFPGVAPQPATPKPDGQFNYAINQSDPGGMPEVFPVAVTQERLSGRHVVWFSDHKTKLDHRYFRMALERFPDARFFSDGKHHVRVEQNGLRVGLICVLTNDSPWPDGVEQLLQSGGFAKAV